MLLTLVCEMIRDPVHYKNKTKCLIDGIYVCQYCLPLVSSLALSFDTDPLSAMILDYSGASSDFWEIMGTRAQSRNFSKFQNVRRRPLLRAYSLLKSPTFAVIEEFIRIFCSNQSIINFTDKHPILLLLPRFKRLFSLA